MSIFRRTKDRDVERLRGEIARLKVIIDQEDARRARAERSAAMDAVPLPGQPGDDDDTLDATAPQGIATPATPPVDVDAVAADVESRLAERLDAKLDALSGRLDALDSRITTVSTELANQVNELGGDIESLSERPPAEIDGAVIDGLRDGQTRLANEQARYQIAFREDLARIAAELKRPT